MKKQEKERQVETLLFKIEKVRFTCMGALFWRSEQPKTETCLSMGTGSALTDGSLQGDGLKAVLTTAVVFGRACGAASTTLTNEKTIEKTWNEPRK